MWLRTARRAAAAAIETPSATASEVLPISMHLHNRGYRSAGALRVGENLQGTTRTKDGGRMQRLDVRGRTSVITGAASGMGAEVARELDRRGARLALIDRNGEGLAALAADLRGTGHTVHAVDLTDDAAVF